MNLFQSFSMIPHALCMAFSTDQNRNKYARTNQKLSYVSSCLFCVWNLVCHGATHQDLGGTGARDVEQTSYSGSSELEKDVSCCSQCRLRAACEYWVRATDSDSCWLKSNDGKEIEEISSTSRRGGFRDAGN